MNRAIVGHKSPDDLYFLDILILPQKHHVVAIDSKKTGPGLVGDYCEHVSVLALLALLHLDFLDTRLNICLAQRWWFLIGDNVLECFGVENANNSISTPTIKQIFGGVDGAIKRPGHLNVHPLTQLALLVENVEVAARGQGVYQVVVAGHADKYLLLNFAQIHALRLQNNRSLLRCLHAVAVD